LILYHYAVYKVKITLRRNSKDMELLDAIKNRRSIREFSPRLIPRKTLEALFSAAIEAPSPKNAQPWNFVVYEGKNKEALISMISKMVEKELSQGRGNRGISETVNIIKNAPVFILVYNRAFLRYANEPDPVTARIIDVQSIGACIQNLLLAAHEKGIGSLWICDLQDIPSVKQMLETKYEMVAALALGYPQHCPQRPPRDPLENVVCWSPEN